MDDGNRLSWTNIDEANESGCVHSNLNGQIADCIHGGQLHLHSRDGLAGQICDIVRNSPGSLRQQKRVSLLS